MKRFLFWPGLLLVLCLLLNCNSIFAQANQTPLTNAAVVKLVKAGFKDKSILTIIASRPVQFDLSTERMIELKRVGVSEKVILAMIARQQGYAFSDEAFGEEFFNDSPIANEKRAPNTPQSGNPSEGSSIDIFSSGGGSKGSTKSRVGGNSNSDDVVTTGSATVRILRPPTEAGAPTKLEKTKPLNNDSIIELVEAGFSEGTIIRRIEQSPVDFDLSPEKLVELRQRRVSEKIVAAMKTAMGVESSASNSLTDNGTPKK